MIQKELKSKVDKLIYKVIARVYQSEIEIKFPNFVIDKDEVETVSNGLSKIFDTILDPNISDEEFDKVENKVNDYFQKFFEKKYNLSKKSNQSLPHYMLAHSEHRLDYDWLGLPTGDIIKKFCYEFITYPIMVDIDAIYSEYGD